MVGFHIPERRGRISLRRFEILGVFGSGKTTLARNLSDSLGALIAEDHQRNPFWGFPHLTESLGFLGYDLEFCIQHAISIVNAADNAALKAPCVCDWSFETDRLWASMRLGEQFSAYEAVFKEITRRIDPPLGYLYLEQPVEIIVSRVTTRGREPEKSFVDHVQRAAESLADLVQKLPASDVLRVNDQTMAQTITAWKQEGGV